MIDNSDKYKQPFGGNLGAEFQRVWDAIRANQITSSPNIRVSRTTGGTQIHTSHPEPSTITAAAAGGGIDGIEAFYPNDSDTHVRYPSTVSGPHLPVTDVNGWITKPYVNVLGDYILLTPLTEEDVENARNAWGDFAAGNRIVSRFGFGYPTPSVDYPTFPHPLYIARNQFGTWQSPYQVPFASPSAGQTSRTLVIYAIRLSVPLPQIGSATQMPDPWFVPTLPQITHIQVHPFHKWTPRIT